MQRDLNILVNFFLYWDFVTPLFLFLAPTLSTKVFWCINVNEALGKKLLTYQIYMVTVLEK